MYAYIAVTYVHVLFAQESTEGCERVWCRCVRAVLQESRIQAGVCRGREAWPAPLSLNTLLV